MPKHKHYDVIKQWLEDTSQTVQTKTMGGWWIDDPELEWLEYGEYRLKPKTHYTARVEIPKAETEEPAEGTQVFVSHISNPGEPMRYTWQSHSRYLQELLTLGLVYFNAEDATAAAKAMLKREEA